MFVSQDVCCYVRHLDDFHMQEKNRIKSVWYKKQSETRASFLHLNRIAAALLLLQLKAVRREAERFEAHISESFELRHHFLLKTRLSLSTALLELRDLRRVADAARKLLDKRFVVGDREVKLLFVVRVGERASLERLLIRGAGVDCGARIRCRRRPSLQLEMRGGSIAVDDGARFHVSERRLLDRLRVQIAGGLVIAGAKLLIRLRFECKRRLGERRELRVAHRRLAFESLLVLVRVTRLLSLRRRRALRRLIGVLSSGGCRGLCVAHFES